MSELPSLRRRCGSDVDTVISWIPDEAALLMFTGPRMAWPPTRGQFEELAAVPGLTAWVMDAAPGSGQVLGHAELCLRGGHAHIARVIVDPLLRGRGLSQQLMRLVLERARAGGAGTAGLRVTKGNTVALRAYRRLGFGIDPRGETADALVLGLDLGQPAAKA
ncbi:GNAT family N-acetyltransferase [Arthrobacter zhaoxinii]|uniref:GNAT family N-acetyltransferase n=1 Tax=Arthrobacter zhaoxinii TaxID=2964616 RepID=A0ABY5YTB0_9MICC|nr:GNAT family N-acetyltransferase [Arthrobacter zhaoxinii]UWX98352.1 GNAT family N-acetyltransferase [Arthrobacter zhaoxinii]